MEKDHTLHRSRSQSSSTFSSDSSSASGSKIEPSVSNTRGSIKSKINTDTLHRTYSGSYPDDTVAYRMDFSPTEENSAQETSETEGNINRHEVNLERGPDAGQNLEKSKTGRSTLANSKLVSLSS